MTTPTCDTRRLDPSTQPTVPVPLAAAYVGVSERSMRRALDPGGELEHLAIRVGRRVVVRTQALVDLVAGGAS